MRIVVMVLGCLALVSSSRLLRAQGTAHLPAVTVQTLTGQSISTETWQTGKGPVIVSFWATWCRPCMQELNAIQALYGDMQARTGVTLYAVSIDDPREASRISALAASKGWTYNLVIDHSTQLKRQMGVVNIPHTFLINQAGEIVYQYNTYEPGKEQELYQQLLRLP